MATTTTSPSGSSSGSPPSSNSRRRLEVVPSESSRARPNRRSPGVRRNRPPAYSRISSDKKDILIKFYEDGKTISESAEVAGININTAKSIIYQYNKNGGVLIEKKRGGRRKVKLSVVLLKRIEEIIEENASITLKNIREKILESEQVELSISSIRNGLNRLRITLKCASLQ